jgi:hypothetical protein
MPAVVIRTLRREFHIPGQAEDSPLRFVAATPTIDGDPPAPTVLALEELHGFVKTRLPTGPVIEGTLRNLARVLDLTTLTCAVADERDAVSLPAALLVSPTGRRVAFVGTRRSGKTSLALALMRAGWAFEGDERLFVRPDGVVAHPRALRLTRTLLRRQPSFAALVAGAPSLDLLHGEVMYALDPRRLAPDWRIRCGPLDAAVFLDGAMARRCSLRRMTLEEAFGRALALCTIAHGVRAHGIALLRAALGRATLHHLQPGELSATRDAVAGLSALAAA